MLCPCAAILPAVLNIKLTHLECLREYINKGRGQNKQKGKSKSARTKASTNRAVGQRSAERNADSGDSHANNENICWTRTAHRPSLLGMRHLVFFTRIICVLLFLFFFSLCRYIQPPHICSQTENRESDIWLLLLQMEALLCVA